MSKSLRHIASRSDNKIKVANPAKTTLRQPRIQEDTGFNDPDLWQWFQRRQPFHFSRQLTLFIAGLHSHAAVRSCRINGATVLWAEKHARTTERENDGFAFRLDFENHVVDGLSVMMLVCVNEARFTQHVEIVRFNDQVAPPAGTTFVAFKVIHALGIVRSAIVVANRENQRSNVQIKIALFTIS